MELTVQNDDLFQMMKASMTTEEEQIFMENHYLYLQHGADSTKFVVVFDDVWKNVGFTRRRNAKRFLKRHFTENENYVISFPKEELLHGKVGGRPKETILLTVDCFKCFCVIASTPKAKTFRSYYTKMENIMCEYYKTTHDELQVKHEVLQNDNDVSTNQLHKEYEELSNIQNKIELIYAVIPLCKNYDEVMDIIDKITSPIT